MTIRVSSIIYFYIYICFALLMFNMTYILRSNQKERIHNRRVQNWLKKIEEECARLTRGEGVSTKHRRELSRRLKWLEVLIAYHDAVTQRMQQDSDLQMQRYLDECYLSFLKLSTTYAKRNPMERAFYAHLMSAYHPNPDSGNRQLIRILLTYFEDSTVFCRENVLQALYSFGNADAVERAFALMNSRGWYHNTHLLADGLASFSGDREALAWRLWRRCMSWSEHFQVAVVQFASGVTDAFSEEFFAALQNEDVPTETKFALLRYFQRRNYPPIKEALLYLLYRDRKDDLAIVAATVISKYPGEDTHQALMHALQSRNWYVRHNAAMSLVSLGCTQEDVEALRNTGDRYGVEMLEYMMERAKEQGKLSVQKQTAHSEEACV